MDEVTGRVKTGYNAVMNWCCGDLFGEKNEEEEKEEPSSWEYHERWSWSWRKHTRGTQQQQWS